MTYPHHTARDASLIVNGDAIPVQVQLKEGRNTLDGRRSITGTLWLSQNISRAAHAAFHATPLTLIMPDGSSERIRVTEGIIYPGPYSPLSFVLERHVRAEADE